MAERIAGPEIERLIQLLARLPGLGPRSARRAALHLIRRREELLGPLADALAVARERMAAHRGDPTATERAWAAREAHTRMAAT
jgi:recombination protein RecR